MILRIFYYFHFRLWTAPTIKVEITSGKGLQGDLFAPDKKCQKGQPWARNIILSNSVTGNSVQIGEGVVRYIEQYGFYEGGGNDNPYRVDPMKLVSILTGSSLSTVSKIAKAK